MRPFLRLTLTGIAAGTVIAALFAAAMPVWLLIRVPGAISCPEPEPGPR